MKKAMFVLISVLVLSTLVLSACAQPTAAPTKAPVATEAPAATEPPAPQPTEAPKELGTADNPIIIALAQLVAVFLFQGRAGEHGRFPPRQMFMKQALQTHQPGIAVHVCKRNPLRHFGHVFWGMKIIPIIKRTS